MSLEYIDAVDRGIITRLVDAALAKGYSLSVDDGEETVVCRSQDKGEVLGALASTDMDTITIDTRRDEHLGSVWLVYGNEPGVVISNHTDNQEVGGLVEAAMEGVDE